MSFRRSTSYDRSRPHLPERHTAPWKGYVIFVQLASPREVWFSELLTVSYQQVVGEPLLPDGDLSGTDMAGWLYEDAPFCLLAHDTQEDPRFIYANLTAQRCFEYSWDEFIGMPSRLSAEAPNRADRQRFMDAVLRQGFVSDYRGKRIAKSDRRFWIERATVWNLLGRDGIRYGQAALIRGWSDA
jgi:hypothetical protein